VASKDELRRKLASLAPADRELLASELAATTPAPPTDAERGARLAEVKQLAERSTLRERARRGTGLKAAAAAGFVTLTRKKPEPAPEAEAEARERERRERLAARPPVSDNVKRLGTNIRRWD
jgi:hypothetical protein